MNTMKSLFLLLICVSLVLAIPLGVPSQKPLISGDQLDWKNADCFPSSSENGNNTICIQQVYDPVIDSDILPLPPANQFCGYMAIGPGPVPPVQLFFWVVLSEHDPAKDPVVLWMNGGPGSTSLYGLFDQWGPRVINHTKRPSVVFKDNPNRLTEKLTWVFLEQPSGTGFSTGGAPVTKSGPAAGDMSKFITALFEPTTKFKFQGTELSLAGLDFHIAGESFAGHYIPALGGYMVKNNQHTKVNLRSFLLGNSMIDPSLKGVAMEKLVCGASPPLTLIGSSPATTAARCRSMHSWKPICDPAIRTCLATPTQVNCDAAYNACYESWGEGWSKKFMRNVYDATKDKANQVATKSFYDNEFANFMNDPARRARLGVAAGPQWHPSSATMVGDFLASGDWMTSYIPQLQDILNSKTIDVLLYAGDQDLICTFTPVKEQALKTKWNESDAALGTKTAKFKKCEARGENTYEKIGITAAAPYGNYIRAGLLTYARVKDAGHISENKPAESKHLFETWIFSRSTFQECNPGP